MKGKPRRSLGEGGFTRGKRGAEVGLGKNVARARRLAQIAHLTVGRWLRGLRRAPGKREWLIPTGGSNPPLSAICHLPRCDSTRQSVTFAFVSVGLESFPVPFSAAVCPTPGPDCVFC